MFAQHYQYQIDVPHRLHDITSIPKLKQRTKNLHSAFVQRSAVPAKSMKVSIKTMRRDGKEMEERKATWRS
jgi:hypothetical protein